ncbi:MAG: dTDP-4-dehydrorhamnose 3,5-epimerase, partial [Bacteroidales bacterium]|nr:dTDP-4-dehydrorhamnose 3,5-epimerase [Bacteroidales bacterium]
RGYFFESFNSNKFKDLGIYEEFVQDNQSLSGKNVLRGFHFQRPPYEQGKLVRVIKGSVLDVAVDLRKKSPSYGKNVAFVLSENNKQMLWIPPGFAHAFLTLEDDTIFFYKCTGLYNKDAEVIISWDDPDINFKWNISDPILSERDKKGIQFKLFNSPF